MTTNHQTASGEQTGTHPIVPEGVTAETLRERIREHTDDPQTRQCPACGYRTIRSTSGGVNGGADHDYYCYRSTCLGKFDAQEVENVQ